MADRGDMSATGELRVKGSVGRRGVTDVEIVIPVYNEETDLESSVRRLHGYLSDGSPSPG